jgi:hypothetical protein
MTTAGTRGIDHARVGEIARMSDPVIRNLYITQGYHDLARQMGGIVGQGNASWATFGCWASKTAGTFIRGQELPAPLARVLKRHPELGHDTVARDDETRALVSGLSDMLLHPLRTSTAALSRILADTSLYIAEGNRVVFAELAGSFADFIDTFGDRDLGDERLAGLLAKYSDGPTEQDELHVDHATETITSTQRGGQSWLKDMLRTLHRAALSDDPNETAQLILLASAYGGLHEQTRLQSYIVASLGTAIDDVFIPQLRSDAPPASETRGFSNRMILRVGRVVAKFGRRLVAEWSSRLMMTMPLPNETIRLGEDIPAEKGCALYPEGLAALSEPELVKIVERYCPDWTKSHNLFRRTVARVRSWLPGRPVVVGVAASNWGVLDQRMRLILAYFRTRQQDVALHDAPFTIDQLAALAAGKLPSGKL